MWGYLSHNFSNRVAFFFLKNGKGKWKMFLKNVKSVIDLVDTKVKKNIKHILF